MKEKLFKKFKIPREIVRGQNLFALFESLSVKNITKLKRFGGESLK